MVRLDLERMEKGIQELCEERERLLECLAEAQNNDGEYYDAKTGLSSEEEFEYEIKGIEDNLDQKYSFITFAILGLSKEDRDTIQSMINNTYTEELSDRHY